MAQFTPDYEHLYMQEDLSDVTLAIRDENETTGAAGQKRKRKSTARTLPGHCVLLLGHSGYCKAKISNWKGDAGSSSSKKGAKQKLEIVLPVPAGQEELAELLIKGIYQKEPTITEGLSHEQLLQLMLLADRFEVPKVQAGVAAAFSTVEPQELQWDTALQLLDLPPSCAQQPEFKAVQQKAVQRLQQQLGDLEEVWADEQLQLQQLLLGLPFSALLQLLQHAETRVATENTVVYTIEEWYEAQPAAAQVVDQLQQLMHLVRVQHCTHYYAGTVMPQSSLVQRCFDQSELLLMHVLCTPDGSNLIRALQTSNAKCPALEKYPAWIAAKRPASTKEPVFEWRLPLDEVQAAVEKVLPLPRDGSSRTYIASSRDYILQGQPVYLAAKLYGDSGDSSDSSHSTSPRLRLGAYLTLANCPVNALRKVSATLEVIEARGSTAGDPLRATAGISRSFNSIYMSRGHGRGFSGLVDLGLVASWQAAEAVLRQKQLVHAGGQGEGAAGPHLLLKVRLRELL